MCQGRTLNKRRANLRIWDETGKGSLDNRGGQKPERERVGVKTNGTEKRERIGHGTKSTDRIKTQPQGSSITSSVVGD